MYKAISCLDGHGKRPENPWRLWMPLPRPMRCRKNLSLTSLPRKRARRGKATADLTDDERAMLGAFDMEAFEEFLTDEHPISEDNRRQVLRQAEKLVSGQGVHYASPTYGWPDDVVFRKGEPVTMSSDIVQIIADARDFEDEHGRDHGNGWLLNHPLRKLLIFQTHVARGEAAASA